MALLQTNNCVFYGRFDGATGPYDHKNNVPLSGGMAYTDGKLNQGLVGRGATTTNGAAATFTGRTTQPAALVKLDSSHVLVCYSDANSVGHGKAKVGTITGQSITWGGETVFASGGVASQIRAAALNSSGVVVCFQDSSQNQNGVARYGVFDGTKINWGNSAKFFTSFGNFSSPAVVPLSTSGFAVAYIDLADHEYGKVVIGQVIGGNVSFGSASMFTDSVGTNSVDLLAVNSTRIMVAYNDANFDYAGKTRLADVVGTSLVWRSPEYFASTGPTWNISLAQVGVFQGSKPRISIGYRGADDYGWSRCVAVNGTTFVWSPAPQQLTYAANKYLPGAHIGMWLLQGACLTKDGLIFNHIADGGMTFANFQWGNPRSVGSFENGDLVGMDAENVVVSYSDPADGDKGKARVVYTQTGRATLMHANTAPGVLSAVGQSGVAVAFWGRRPTFGTQSLTVRRGHTTTIYDHQISLQGSGATQHVQWSGGTVETVLANMNDGGWHYVAFHFKRGTGANWGLQTSIDGAAYVNHGNQVSGSWTGAIGNTPFAIDYKSQASGSIDELAMWFVPTPFTQYQTSGMYTLGAAGHGLDQYTTYCASSISGWRTAHIYGPTAITQSLNTFLKADDLPFESSGVVFYHPLNNNVEWTRSSGWRGEGEYITGQIDKALCPDFSTYFTVKASGFLTHNRGVQPHIAYAKDNVAMVLTASGTAVTQVGVMPVRCSGNQIQYGLWYRQNVADATAGNGRAMIPLTDTTAMTIISSQNNTTARIVKVNTDDLTLTSGAIYTPTNWAHTYDGVGTAGFHGSLAWIEGVVMSTSGDNLKVLLVADDTYKQNGQVFIVHVSGMTIQYISPWKFVSDDINDGGSHMLCRLDDTHAIIHHGSVNRFRMATITPDGSGVTLGREHIDISPGQCYYSDILKLNDQGGILMLGTTNNSAVKFGNAIMPILFGESGISHPLHPSGWSPFKMGVNRIGITSQSNVNNDVRMIRLSDTRFAAPMHAPGWTNAIYFMENRPTGIVILGSGALGTPPYNQTDDFATHITMAQVDSSGVFIAYRRVSDGAGVGRICHLGGNGPTVDTGTPTVFSNQGARFNSVANWGTSGLVLAWLDATDSNRIKCASATFQNGAITYNTPVFVGSGYTGESLYPVRILPIDGNRFALFYPDAQLPLGSKARVVTANPDGSLTLGTPVLYCGHAGGNQGTHNKPFKISPSGFGVFYIDQRPANRPRAIYGSFQLSGTNSLVYTSGTIFDGLGAPTKYHQGSVGEHHGTAVVGDKIYTTWCDTTIENMTDSVPYARAARINPTSGLTWLGEPKEQYWECTGYSQQAVANMGYRRFLHWARMYEQVPGGGIVQIFEFDVDRDEIVRLHPWSGAKQVPLNQYPQIRATRLSDNTAACIGQSVAPYPSTLRLIKYVPASGGPVDGPATNLINPTGSVNYLHAGPNGKLVYASNQEASSNPVRACFGFVDVNSSGYVSPPDSSPYGTTTGDEQFMLMTWTQNPTTSGTTVNIGRGLKFQLVESKIRFGTNTVEWDLPTVSGVLASLNDGRPHQVILDVQHQGDGDWVLRTSVDGGDWVSHGVQTSGTEAVPASEGPAVIEILPTKPEMTQSTWLDDVYLYAGPKSVDLTGVDRQRIYSIGAYKQAGLNQYGTYGLSHAASGAVFLQGALNFFHASRAKLYQTYDNEGGKPREYLTGDRWENSSPLAAWLVQGIAGQGGYREGWGTHTWYEPVAANVSHHGALSGATPYDMTDWTLMTWWDCNERGRYGSDEILVGQGDGSNNSIGFAAAGTSGIKLMVCANGTKSTVGQVDYSTPPGRRMFLLGRVEFMPEGTAKGYLSVNGEGWQDLGTVTLSNPVAVGSRYAVRTSLVSSPARNSLLDETVLWQGVPLFNDLEVFGLYQLGLRGLDLGNNSDKIYGPFTTSASLPLHIGPILRSNSTRAVCKGPTYPPDFDGLVFYQPCDSSLEEYVHPESAWSTDADSVPGLIDDGLGMLSPDMLADTLVDSSIYVQPGEFDSHTALFWMSGVQYPSGTVNVGWKSGLSNQSMLGIKIASPSGVSMILTSQGYTWESTPLSVLQFNPTMFVVRVENAAQPTCLVSVDGSGWVDLGNVPLPAFDADVTSLGISAFSSAAESGSLWYDEVALWAGTDRFTGLQLAELYEMGRSRRVPLPEYTDQWDENGLWISGCVPCHTLHLECLSESGQAFAAGHLGVNGMTRAVIPYFPAITGKPYVERMVYFLTGDDGQEIVAGQAWSGPLTAIATSEGTGFASTTDLVPESAADYSLAAVANLSWHLLVKKLGGSVSVGRNPFLFFNGTDIRLGTDGGGNVYWSGPAVSGLYASVQDELHHYLILNFTYAGFIGGSHKWLMKISRDGRPYVSYGMQSLGSLPVPTSSPEPGTSMLTVANRPADAYLDEVILWKDVDFTDDELAVLGHAPSGTYGYQLGFVGNYEVPTPVGTTYDFTIESLLQTHDHYPQIIGKLDVVSPETVNIEVWSCTSGNVTPLVLTSAACYAIGTTGRWGWSTVSLPAERPNRHPQYYYRMTSGNGSAFEGVFFLERAKRRSPRGMPSSPQEYLVPRQ